jgi:transcriptional regulator with XRE-family HTH domain
VSGKSSQIINLLRDKHARAAYIRGKLGVLVPSQIRALRLKSALPTQKDLAKVSGIHQSRISMLETPGASNVTLETLAKLAAIFKVGLIVKFVPFSEMLRWENDFSQDSFNVIRLEDDAQFIAPLERDWTEAGSCTAGMDTIPLSRGGCRITGEIRAVVIQHGRTTGGGTRTYSIRQSSNEATSAEAMV